MVDSKQLQSLLSQRIQIGGPNGKHLGENLLIKSGFKFQKSKEAPCPLKEFVLEPATDGKCVRIKNVATGAYLDASSSSCPQFTTAAS